MNLNRITVLLIIIYFYSFLLIWAITHGQVKYKKTSQTIETYISFITLFLFFGFRDLPILNDTAHYYEHFRGIINDNYHFDKSLFYIDIYERFEYGYLVFERILSAITNEPYVIILVSSFIISAVYIWFIKKFTRHVALYTFLLLSLFYLTPMYSGIRQSFANCIFFIAYPYLMQKKIFRYYCLILIAILFHKSAYILLVLPAFLYINLNKKNIIAIICISIFFSANILKVMGSSAIFESAYYMEQLDREVNPTAAILNMITICLYIIWSFYIKKRYKIDANENKLLWWISIFNLSINICSINFLILARYTLYFNILTVILLLSHIFTMTKKDRKKNLSFLILFVSIRFITILILKNEWYHIYPYSFYDFTKPYHDTNTGY